MSKNIQFEPDRVTYLSIIDALMACYGSLAAPDFRKIYVTLRSPLHQSISEGLRSKGVDIIETTDENDDVSTQLVATQSGDQVALGLSGVGPVAAVVHQGKDGRSCWVTLPDQAPSPLAALVAAYVAAAGFVLLDRDMAMPTITMNRAGGDAKATLYQALFTDSDNIP